MGKVGTAITDRQIWERVFEGRVQYAIDCTHKSRKSGTWTQDQSESTTLTNMLYFDPSLASNSGHQLHAASAYVRLTHELTYRCFVMHAYNSSVRRQQHWQAYFLVPHHTLAFRAIKTQQELIYVQEYFEYEFGTAIKRYKPKICVFATIRFINIVAAVKAVTSQQTTMPRAIIFTVFEAYDAPDCSNPDIVRSAFVEAATILRRYEMPNRIIVETNYLRNFLLECGFQSESVRIYEYVAAKQITDGVVLPVKSDARVRIGFVGNSRRVRNPELIADLLIEQAIPESIRWCVQLDLEYIKRIRGQDTVKRIRVLHEQGKIELYSGELTEQKYRTLFCSLDIIVMPYSERYQMIGSGIFSEAIYAEVIPIMPDKSSMNDLYTSLGGNAPTFQTLSLTTLQQAITDGINRLTCLKQSAKRIKADWIKHPSSAEQSQRSLANWMKDFK